MRKQILRYFIILAVLGAFAWAFYSIFEIEEYEKWVSPSREAMTNNYLGLDRWLNSASYKVRVLSSGNAETIKTASEKTIFIQTELFEWSEQAVHELDAWIQNGGSLILCLNYFRSWDNGSYPGIYLNGFGIESETEPNDFIYNYNSGYPSYGRNIHFKEFPDAVLSLTDEHNLIRLIQISHGGGRITLTGRPGFFSTRSLEIEANAALAWFLLTGGSNNIPENDEDAGILFIRGFTRSAGLMGRVFQYGNFGIIIISLAILIIAGFWAVIPVFGIVKNDEEKQGKLLRERFLAEAWFLKRFGALEYYNDVYMREIKRRLIKQKNLTEEEVATALADAIARTEASSLSKKTGEKKFKQNIIFFKSILETL